MEEQKSFPTGLRDPLWFPPYSRDARPGLLVEAESTQAFEMDRPCIVRIEHRTNQCVTDKAAGLIGTEEALLATPRLCKITWFVHVTHHYSLSKNPRRLTGEDKEVFV